MHFVRMGAALCSVAIALVAGCREKTNSMAVKDVVVPPSGNTSGAQSPPVPAGNDDLPPIGRSMFDYVLAANGNTVPFPFEKLAKALTVKTEAPLAALIPFGRSLQKNAADLKSPRIILAAPGAFAGDSCEIPQNNTIFIGYAEQANSLEVISFNDKAGRVEFQIVKDYAEGKKPKVFYANRTLCLTCHQNGGPIFTPDPWLETNNEGVNPFPNEIIKDLIAANPGKKHFHGVAYKRSPENLSNPAIVTFVNSASFERAVDIVAKRSAANELWARGCGSDPVEGPECRGLVLRFALRLSTYWPQDQSEVAQKLGALRIDRKDPKYERLVTLWQKYWPSEGIAIYPTLIPSRDPVAQNQTLTVAQDPLTPRPPRIVIKRTDLPDADFKPQPINPFGGPTPTDVVPSMNIAISYLQDLLLSDHFTRLNAAIDSKFDRIDAVIKSAAVKPLLSTERLASVSLVDAILDGLGAERLPSSCFASDANLPDPMVLNGGTILTEASSGKVALFKSYCDKCHTDTGDESFDFFAGNDEAVIWKRLAGNPEVKRRLEWEATTLAASEQMPPKSSPKGKIIRTAEFSADRLKMIAFLKEAL